MTYTKEPLRALGSAKAMLFPTCMTRDLDDDVGLGDIEGRVTNFGQEDCVHIRVILERVQHADLENNVAAALS